MADNLKQFSRTYELSIGKPQSKGVSIEGDEKENKGVQISFSITKNINNTEDKDACQISLVNLSQDTLNYIKEESSAIQLKVGYEGDNRTLFQGIVQEIEGDDGMGGTDRVTTLRCVPGDSLIYKNTLSKSFPPNTTPKQIINHIIGNSESLVRASFNSEVIDKQFPFGYSIEGSAQDTLKELSRDFGFDWRIVGDKLFISDKDKYERSDSNSSERVFVLSPTTGLKGRPIYVKGDGREVEGSENKRKGVKFTSFINALIRPGSAVKVSDTQLPGVYRVNSVEYKGDWRGGDWDAVYTCSKI